MTTGEKLAKLRHEYNYTQEQLSEIIGVSRQSISKWESDGAFPETEKLIQLSRLYKCSIDYLLKEEIEEKEINSTNKVNVSNNSLKKYLTKDLYTSLWSIGYFILMLLFYFFPCATAGFNGYINIKVNYYNLLGAGNYQFGNYFVLLSLLVEISIVILSIVIYCINKNKKKLYFARRILSIVVAVIYIIVLLIIVEYSRIGIIFIILLSIGNTLGLHMINFNKYKEV
jgi:transcriptional regulator with XRE-family HTH domain